MLVPNQIGTGCDCLCEKSGKCKSRFVQTNRTRANNCVKMEVRYSLGAILNFMKLVLQFSLVLILQLGDSSADELSFTRDVRPILSDRCFHCHGPDADNQDSEFRLDSEEHALADLGGYAGIVPGNLNESELHLRIRSKDESERMPPPEAVRCRYFHLQVLGTTGLSGPMQTRTRQVLGMPRDLIPIASSLRVLRLDQATTSAQLNLPTGAVRGSRGLARFRAPLQRLN